MAWFKSWFNTPYYHLLYRHRNHEEADRFIHALIEKFNPPKQSYILDIGCGKGRHANIISELNYRVTGIDLSENSIMEAANNGSAEFYVHDMRQLFRTNCYDFVLNLFTSFGYFHDVDDELQTIRAMAANLKPGGMLLIDYLNAHLVREQANMTNESISIEGINFSWHKYVEDGFVKKRILVNDGEQKFTFEEQVHLLDSDDFRHYFGAAGLEPVSLYGDYHFNAFDPKNSPRLILTAIKTAI